MIRNPDKLRRFEDDRIRREKPDFQRNLRMVDAMYEHARALGAFPPGDPLEGIEVDLRLARALNLV